eukprot:scaffold71520_cov50-Attheya_sp.AAC.7
MGGEEQTGETEAPVVVMDEQTGLSSWGTVSVRTVTVHQEEKEERARARLKRREEARIAQEKEQETRARKMEEAKHANADDSALGAYAPNNPISGYKGVDIHTDAKVNVQDTAKSLSKGKGKVAFKTRKKRDDSSSSMFQNAKKKQNRRTTYADDD